MVMAKKKTVSKVANVLKATVRAKELDIKATVKAKAKAPLKAKATVKAKAKAKATEKAPKKVDESEQESEEESEEEAPMMKKPAAVTGKLAKSLAKKIGLMKKPAAAAVKKAEVESEEESEEEEVEEAVSNKKISKKPAAAQKKMDVDASEEEEESDEEEAEDSEEDEEEVTSSKKTMKKPAAAAKKADAEDSEKESEEEESEDEDEEEEETAAPISKKPAANKDTDSMDVEESDEEEESEDEEVGAQLVAVDEPKEATEKEVAAERTKELKSIGASDLKELLVSNGLATGTKEVMIKALLKHEAKVRVAAKEQKAKIRGVVVEKKLYLEGLSLPELGKLCNDAGVKGLKGKPEKVQRLLIHWQESDGVDQALNKIVQDDRKKELSTMDTTKLQKLCNKLGVDPFVKEVMVERMSKQENQMGCYARPGVKQVEEEAKGEKKGDMIDELLASEAQWKKERELKSKQEEVVLKKRKELKAMSKEDLKKRLAKKGLETTGKTDEMVEALFIAAVQEDRATARKSELQVKSAQELKDLLSLNGLETGGKDQMVKTMLAHEAKCHEELKVFERKIDLAAGEKAKQLESKSNANLKELCAAKALAVKGEKNERIERIVEEAKKEGEFDRIVSTNSRNKRKDELMSLDKPSVLKLCEKSGVDPFVKDIMVERIMSQESEAGAAIAADDEPPAAKKARASRK